MQMELTDRGYFKGYASIFDAPDLTNDIIAPGAFRESLENNNVSKVRMLYQHDASQIIGSWHKIEENERGLYVEGSLLLDIARANEIYIMIKAGALDGLSIGFRTVRAQPSRSSYRFVQEIDLAEISIVTFPMHPDARIANTLSVNNILSPVSNLASSIRMATHALSC